MKKWYSTSLLALLALSVTTHAYAELQPYSMLEELRTGAISIGENKLITGHGQEVQLKLMKQRDRDYSTDHFYEIIRDDIHLCDDGTPAHYLSIESLGSDTTVVSSYQKRTNNDLGNEYIVHCSELVYE